MAVFLPHNQPVGPENETEDPWPIRFGTRAHIASGRRVCAMPSLPPA